jgi:hypothetical protein
METLDYEKDLDPNITGLVRSLNLFHGIHTVSSCGGHKDPVNDSQYPEGNWYVGFDIDRDTNGWFALEFLAWAINYEYVKLQHHHVCLYPEAKPPFDYLPILIPGELLGFIVEGKDGEDPQALANWIEQVKEQHYIPPDKVVKFTEDYFDLIADEPDDDSEQLLDNTDLD